MNIKLDEFVAEPRQCELLNFRGICSRWFRKAVPQATGKQRGQYAAKSLG